MNRDTKRKILYEVLTILGVIALLTFICRLWALLILVIFIAIIAAARLLVLKVKDKNTEQTNSEQTPVVSVSDEEKLIDMVYSAAQSRITSFVEREYPNAKWVWDNSKAKSAIEKGDDVFIILNSAGDYKRAKVVMKNLIVVGLDFEKQQEQTPQQSEVLTDITTTAEPECDTVNYELVAFEWVEANAVSLNERCNEAIGKGETELLLTASELPPAMSWDNVCKELVRAGLKTAECCADGIKIKLN